MRVGLDQQLAALTARDKNQASTRDGEAFRRTLDTEQAAQPQAAAPVREAAQAVDRRAPSPTQLRPEDLRQPAKPTPSTTSAQAQATAQASQRNATRTKPFPHQARPPAGKAAAHAAHDARDAHAAHGDDDGDDANAVTQVVPRIATPAATADTTGATGDATVATTSDATTAIGGAATADAPDTETDAADAELEPGTSAVTQTSGTPDAIAAAAAQPLTPLERAIHDLLEQTRGRTHASADAAPDDDAAALTALAGRASASGSEPSTSAPRVAPAAPAELPAEAQAQAQSHLHLVLGDDDSRVVLTVAVRGAAVHVNVRGDDHTSAALARNAAVLDDALHHRGLSLAELETSSDASRDAPSAPRDHRDPTPSSDNNDDPDAERFALGGHSTLEEPR